MKNAITPELLTDLKNGDHQAFETVFIAYFCKIKFFITQLIKSETDAEELTQDLFVKLWEKRFSLDTSQPISSLLYTMSRNAAFNYIKHQSVKQNYVLEYLPPDESDTPDEILYAKEMALLIEMTVCKMPVQRQNVFRLSRGKGLTNEEIAEKLHISKKTVENQLSLAIRDLRKMIHLFTTIFI